MLKIFKQNEEVYTDLLNKLLVVYALTFPIKHYANGTVFFVILLVWLINYLKNRTLSSDDWLMALLFPKQIILYKEICDTLIFMYCILT